MTNKRKQKEKELIELLRNISKLHEPSEQLMSYAQELFEELAERDSDF